MHNMRMSCAHWLIPANGTVRGVLVVLCPCRMPWVFTYNDWSAGTEYDMMAKAAVVSAIKVRGCGTSAHASWAGLL